MERTRREGEFVLRSGEKSDHFYECSDIYADPRFYLDLLRTVEHEFPVDAYSFYAFAGVLVGSLPLATSLSTYFYKPLCWTREPKDHGIAASVEGAAVEGARVLVIEDVVTTGGSVAKVVDTLREAEAEVEDVYCLIKRGDADDLPDVNLHCLVDMT